MPLYVCAGYNSVHLHPFHPILHCLSTYLLNQLQDRRINISTLVKSLLIVSLTASIEVLSQICGNNGVEIQDMELRILHQTMTLMLGQKFITIIIWYTSINFFFCIVLLTYQVHGHWRASVWLLFWLNVGKGEKKMLHTISSMAQYDH